IDPAELSRAIQIVATLTTLSNLSAATVQQTAGGARASQPASASPPAASVAASANRALGGLGLQAINVMANRGARGPQQNSFGTASAFARAQLLGGRTE